ncbi:MAG: hypothetical protein GY845_25950 [Planctomycetes bacterium]|nr:hypothetical protein [Planctomycetota bacterium]
MSDNNDPLAFLRQTKAVEQEVNGKKEKFYPVAVGSLMELKLLEGKVLANLGVLFGNKDKDATQQTRNREIKDEKVADWCQESIAVDLAQFRSEERKGAIEGLIDGFFSGDNMNVLAVLIMSSMRDKFDPEDNKVTPEQFLGSVAAQPMVEMTKGLISANAGVLAPFFEKLLGYLKGATAKKLGLDQTIESISKNVKSSKKSGKNK